MGTASALCMALLLFFLGWQIADNEYFFRYCNIISQAKVTPSSWLSYPVSFSNLCAYVIHSYDRKVRKYRVMIEKLGNTEKQSEKKIVPEWHFAEERGTVYLLNSFAMEQTTAKSQRVKSVVYFPLPLHIGGCGVATAKLCSAPSVLSFGEPAWRSCPSADKPILGVERTGVAEPDHTLYLKLPLECDIDHTCSDSVGQGKLHGCGQHQWSRNVSLGNFGNRIYSRYLWEIIYFVIILVTNNSFIHT